MTQNIHELKVLYQISRTLLTHTDLKSAGQKVMEILGIEPGPEVGKILQDLLEIVTDQPELNNEYDLIRILKNHFKTSPQDQSLR